MRLDWRLLVFNPQEGPNETRKNPNRRHIILATTSVATAILAEGDLTIYSLAPPQSIRLIIAIFR